MLESICSALLIAQAAFRAGAGKVTIASVAPSAFSFGSVLQIYAIEALAETKSDETSPNCLDLMIVEMANHYAILIGPAMIDEALTG